MRRDTTIRNGNLNLAVRDYGGNGRPIVLVHGGPGQNLATWDDFAAALRPELHPVALDMRGNGASDDSTDYRWPALASDIDAVVRHFGMKRPLLLGHSWGGQLVTYCASLYHDYGAVIAVEGWITDTYSEFGDDVWKWIEESYTADPLISFSGTASQLEPRLLEIGQTFGPSAEAVARRQFVESNHGMYRCRRTARELVHIQRSIDREARALTTDLYAAISCPVLLIGGAQSEEQVQLQREGRLGEWGFSRRATDPIVSTHKHVSAEWWACGHDVPHELLAELVARTKSMSDAVGRR